MDVNLTEAQLNQLVKEITKKEELISSPDNRIINKDEIKKLDNLILFGIKKLTAKLTEMIPDSNYDIQHTYSAQLTVQEYSESFDKATFFYKLYLGENAAIFFEIDPIILFALVNTNMPEGEFTPTKFQIQMIQSYIISPLIEIMTNLVSLRETEREKIKCSPVSRNQFLEETNEVRKETKGLLFQYLWNLHNKQWALTNMFLTEEILNLMRETHAI